MFVYLIDINILYVTDTFALLDGKSRDTLALLKWVSRDSSALLEDYHVSKYRENITLQIACNRSIELCDIKANMSKCEVAHNYKHIYC